MTTARMEGDPMNRKRNEKNRLGKASRVVLSNPDGKGKGIYPKRIRGMRDKFSDLLVVECVTKPRKAGK
jgi:stalled ribosome alternative rescue factor ArfA